MSRAARILHALPATVCELAAIEETTVRNINADLCYLRDLKLVRRTDRRGERYENRGRFPHICERVA